MQRLLAVTAILLCCNMAYAGNDCRKNKNCAVQAAAAAVAIGPVTGAKAGLTALQAGVPPPAAIAIGATAAVLSGGGAAAVIYIECRNNENKDCKEEK